MERLKEAILFALRSHSTQKRKTKDSHYFWHSFSVARLVEEFGGSEDAVIAAVLHDVVEDTSISLEEITQKFGEKVAGLVSELTSEKATDWKEKKQKTLEKFKIMSIEAKLIKLADKVDNLEDIKRDLLAGRNPWQYFNAGRDMQRWYYGQFLSMAKEDPYFMNHPLTRLLEKAFREVFNDQHF
ncbi:MAG: HD domain-containing protein [Candidatus Nanohaloarchaeota archaeon]|nr:HD domain-containing protein [Candidatus Nanohaloarchaeota archaeon]